MSIVGELVDQATIFNFIGEDSDGNAVYEKTLLDGCRVVLSMGAVSENEDDNLAAYLFDVKTVARSGNIVKSYCAPEAYETLIDKSRYWTIRTDGKDWIAKGACDDSGVPENAFRIRICKRNQIGSQGMWHWKVTAR